MFVIFFCSVTRSASGRGCIPAEATHTKDVCSHGSVKPFVYKCLPCVYMHTNTLGSRKHINLTVLLQVRSTAGRNGAFTLQSKDAL